MRQDNNKGNFNNNKKNNKPRPNNKKIKNPDPMSNPVSMGRHGIKLIKDIAFGKYNIYEQGHVFRNMDFVMATLREVDEKIVVANVYCLALNNLYYQQGGHPVVHDLLKRHNKSLTAWNIVKQVLIQILNTGDTGPLLVLANQLPQFKHDM